MHILVFRLSAMGDVALTLPVLKGLLNTYPNTRITLVTRKVFSPFFANLERLQLFIPDFSGRHKGLFGVFKFFLDLKKTGRYDIIVDLHQVIRTELLCGCFRVTTGKQCFSIKKDRKQKKLLLKKPDEPTLMPTSERYSAVFQKAGFNFKIPTAPMFNPSDSDKTEAQNYLIKHDIENNKLIGIAPYAKHSLKMYPEDKFEILYRMLSETDYKIIFFGGGKTEIDKLYQTASKFDNFYVAEIGLSAQLALMQKLRVMISMDSANMHIAALSGIPVLSIWGATHPGMGFGPLYQPNENTIQISVKELNCRPCTIYGKGTCRRGDFACMNRIDPKLILNRITNFTR